MERPLYVEASPLLDRHPTGLGRFAARLIDALSRRHALRLFIPSFHVAGGSGSFRGEAVDVPRGSLPRADGDLARWAANVFHPRRRRRGVAVDRDGACVYTALRPDRRWFARELSILHDFTPVLLPGAHVPDTRRRFGEYFSRTLALGDHAIAISAATRADACWLSPMAPSSITVCHPGPSLCVESHASGNPVARSAGAPISILVVATDEPRKNLAFVRDWLFATDLFTDEVELRWVGGGGWMSTGAGLAARRGRRRFRRMGIVSDAALCELYRQATFTLYPSLYEGFGLPVLDSLRHGTPVATSDNSSLGEFAGPGVHFFDPCDTASLDGAVRELLAARGRPIAREDLEERCSWDRLAVTVLAAAEDLTPAAAAELRPEGGGDP